MIGDVNICPAIPVLPPQPLQDVIIVFSSLLYSQFIDKKDREKEKVGKTDKGKNKDRLLHDYKADAQSMLISPSGAEDPEVT